MLELGILIGSARPERKANAVARWVYEIASKRTDASFELVDIAQFDLPHLEEAIPLSMRQYADAQTKAWSAKIDAFDGFVFITPEYDHGASAALLNAIDIVYREWHDKAAGFVSYGNACRTRAVDQLTSVMADIQVVHVHPQVALSVHTDFESCSVLRPAERKEASLEEMLDELATSSAQLKILRAGELHPATPAARAARARVCRRLPHRDARGGRLRRAG